MKLFSKVILFPVLISVFVLSCYTKTKTVLTNYFDLPQQFESQFENTLKLKNTRLTDESIEIIKKYVQNFLLAENNPVSSGFNSNYFWYVYNALPDFVAQNERHQGYYVGQNDQPFEQKLIAYAIYRVDRSSENVQTIFDEVKPILTTILSKEKFDELGLDYEVNALISIYEEISVINNYSELLSEAYNHVDTATGIIYKDGVDIYFEPFNAAYGLSAYDLGIIICQYLEIDRYSIYYGSPYLSFWMRRNKEGNMETVYKILKEIQKLY